MYTARLILHLKVWLERCDEVVLLVEEMSVEENWAVGVRFGPKFPEGLP